MLEAEADPLHSQSRKSVVSRQLDRVGKKSQFLPNLSSLNLIFNRAGRIAGQDSFYDKWLAVLHDISKMMGARSCELVVFSKECRNLLFEVFPT